LKLKLKKIKNPTLNIILPKIGTINFQGKIVSFSRLMGFEPMIGLEQKDNSHKYLDLNHITQNWNHQFSR
jgi:hypothetical protein